MFRVCFVAPFAYPIIAGREDIQAVGGAELQQVIIGRELAQRGYPVSMICLDFGQPVQIQHSGVSVHRAYAPNAGLPVLRFIYPRLTSIWACLNAVDADVYYSRSASILPGIIAFYCKMKEKKSIFAAAGNPDFHKNTDRIRFARDRRIYEYGLRNSTVLVAQNEDQIRLCEKNYRRKPVLIENCLPKPTGRRAREATSILWVSTIRALKRPELFLDLARSFPELQFEMVGGPDNRQPGLYDKIKHAAESIPNLTFFGFVAYDEIDAFFDRARIVINTSDSEGFPNTFLQAWSRGVPTVSFVDCGAYDDAGPVGYIAADLEDMKRKVSTLMVNPEEWASLARRSRRYYESHHKPEVAVAKYIELFNRLERLEAA